MISQQKVAALCDQQMSEEEAAVAEAERIVRKLQREREE